MQFRAAGCTDYYNQSLTDMFNDIKIWRTNTEKDLMNILSDYKELHKNGEWNKIDWDYQTVIKKTIQCTKSLLSDLDIVINNISSDSVNERAICLLEDIGERTLKLSEELNTTFYKSDYCNSTANLGYEIAYNIWCTAGDMYADMWDASNMVEPMRKKYMKSNMQDNTIVNTIYGSNNNIQIQQGNSVASQSQNVNDSIDEEKINELLIAIKKYETLLDDEFGSEGAAVIRKNTYDLSSDSKENKINALSCIKDVCTNAAGSLIASGILQLITKIMS